MNFFTGKMAKKFGAATLGVRAEHLEIVDKGDWSGKVVHSENLGSDSFVYIDTGEEVPVVVRQSGRPTCAVGDQVSLSPINSQVHKFGQDGKPVA